jgi:hypothetical protein
MQAEQTDVLDLEAQADEALRGSCRMVLPIPKQ